MQTERYIASADLGSSKIALTVAKVDVENNLIAIKGAIPGPKGGIVILADTVKSK